MERTCGVCQTPFDAPREDREPICPACRQDAFVRARKPLREYLDSLAAAVLLVDDDARVKLANRKALELLQKDPGSLEGRYAGDAIECVHARESGGCGKTEHCRTCTIRGTVLETYHTGRPRVRIPAYPDVFMLTEKRPLRFFISTEKIGELVMLRIDEV